MADASVTEYGEAASKEVAADYDAALLMEPGSASPPASDAQSTPAANPGSEPSSQSTGAASQPSSSVPDKLNTAENQADLARVIMSETSGFPPYATLVGFGVVNRLVRNDWSSTKQVKTLGRNQKPTNAVVELAKKILAGQLADPSDGLTHWYSPISMPKVGDPVQGYDTKGGLEQVEGLEKQNYRPPWSISADFEELTFPGVKPKKFKFFRFEGKGLVK
jgi:hypothetical protein